MTGFLFGNVNVEEELEEESVLDKVEEEELEDESVLDKVVYGVRKLDGSGDLMHARGVKRILSTVLLTYTRCHLASRVVLSVLSRDHNVPFELHVQFTGARVFRYNI